jgi:cytochrome b6-f complex iron-sulfur subunit
LAEAGAPPTEPLVDRRAALKQAGAGLLWFTGGGWALAALQHLFPNFLYGASLAFKAGYPQEYSLGVSARFLDSHRVWVVRTTTGFYALWARCPHVGGTAVWQAQARRFYCECHGSSFSAEGRYCTGPAKQGLAHCAIHWAADGQLRIDKARTTTDPRQDTDRAFFLRYPAQQERSSAATG